MGLCENSLEARLKTVVSQSKGDILCPYSYCCPAYEILNLGGEKPAPLVDVVMNLETIWSLSRGGLVRAGSLLGGG